MTVVLVVCVLFSMVYIATMLYVLFMIRVLDLVCLYVCRVCFVRGVVCVCVALCAFLDVC